MKVRCIANTRQKLLPTTVERVGDTIMEAQAPLKIGETYPIYGQYIANGVLCYLLIGTYENLPSWYPAELFEVVNPRVHLEWYYQSDFNAVIHAIWGYEELVLTKDHYISLMEREENAIRIFLKRKKESDEF